MQLINETTATLNSKAVLYTVWAVLMNFPNLTHSIESRASKIIIKKVKVLLDLVVCDPLVLLSGS